MTTTLVATPDPRPDPECSCGFQVTHTRSGYQWVFRRDPACNVHPRTVLDEILDRAK